MPKTPLLAAAAFLALLAGPAAAQNNAPSQSSSPAPPAADQAAKGGAVTGQGGAGAATPSGDGREATKDRGIIGIYPALGVDKVGAPGRLVVRGVVPYSPAYYAGIERGDQITAVDGQPIDGKALDAIAAAIRGEPGTTIKLALSRDGQRREVSLTRVEPLAGRGGHPMWRRHEMGAGGMEEMHGMEGMHGMMGMERMRGMMGGHHPEMNDEGGDDRRGMMAMMGRMRHMEAMMSACRDMMHGAHGRDGDPPAANAPPSDPAPAADPD